MNQRTQKVKETIIKCRFFVVAAAYLVCTFLPLFSGEAEIGSLMRLTLGDKDYESYVYALSACCMTFCGLAIGYALRGIDCLVNAERFSSPPLWSSLFATVTEFVLMLMMKHFSFAPFGIKATKIMTIFAVTIFVEVLCIVVRFARGRVKGKLSCGIAVVATYTIVCLCWTVFAVWALNGKTERDAVAYFDARIEKCVSERDELVEKYETLDGSDKAESLVRIAELNEEIDKLTQRRDELGGAEI